MLKRSMQAMTATKLRAILLGSMALVIVLCAVGFWFFKNQLITYADQVKADSAAASVSSNDITRLQQLQNKLEVESVAVTRAKNIVADSKYYQYQNQIITDITAYAKSSGLRITNFTFTTDSVQGAKAGAAASGAAAAPPVAGDPTPAGIKSLTATIAIQSPANYQAVMKFIHSIEANLTKMQLTGISITKSTKNSGDVSVNPFSIEVYTR